MVAAQSRSPSKVRLAVGNAPKSSPPNLPWYGPGFPPRLYSSSHSLVDKNRSRRNLRRGGLGHGSNVSLAEILGLTGLAVLLRY
jgi:hypothetical protein